MKRCIHYYYLHSMYIHNTRVMYFYVQCVRNNEKTIYIHILYQQEKKNKNGVIITSLPHTIIHVVRTVDIQAVLPRK